MLNAEGSGSWEGKSEGLGGPETLGELVAGDEGEGLGGLELLGELGANGEEGEGVRGLEIPGEPVDGGGSGVSYFHAR